MEYQYASQQFHNVVPQRERSIGVVRHLCAIGYHSSAHTQPVIGTLRILLLPSPLREDQIRWVHLATICFFELRSSLLILVGRNGFDMSLIGTSLYWIRIWFKFNAELKFELWLSIWDLELIRIWLLIAGFHLEFWFLPLDPSKFLSRRASCD